MELADFEKAADKRTGLVAMKIVRPFMPYAANQVAGFPPDIAMGYEVAGIAVRHVKRDKDVVDSSGPAALSHGAAPVPGPELAAARLTRYDRAPEISPAAQTAPPVGLSAGGKITAADIPDGWESFPAAKLRSLGADLSGRTYQTLSEAAAREIITNAIAGRHPDDTGTGAPSIAAQEDAAASQQGNAPAITSAALGAPQQSGGTGGGSDPAA
jgi:hypothetical protein